ncbi:MAG: patatin-like phospholipase family protein [Bacteroidales bacterium]|nr:patatin-like phospholipase family protein [Bacteroidales bacterium]
MGKKNVALVLSSGGARGLAHIGAIEALEEFGYTITSIAGTSMGSLVGGIYANGNLAGFRDFITGLSKVGVIRLMDLAVSKGGIIKGEKVFNEIKRFIGDGNIEDLAIPFSAVATDLFNHREVIFRHGNLLNALRASAAIPTVLLPQQQEQSFLVDGAIVNPLPINRVERKPGDILIAINVNAPRKNAIKQSASPEKRSYNSIRGFVNNKWNGMLAGHKTDEKQKYGFFDIVSGSFEMVQYKLTESVLMQQKVDLLVNMPVNLAEMFEFYRAGELIKAGYNATKQQLADLDSGTGKHPGIVEEWFI